MNMDLILVRHGETKYNRADVFRGRANLELDDRGRLQAEAAGAYLSGLDFDAFYSSPLLRAMETAQAIAASHGGAVAALPDFIDVDYGDWSGKSVAEVRANWPHEFETWISNPEMMIFPDGESMHEVRERVRRGLQRLEEGDRTRMLLVGHKLINRVIICAFLGMPLAGIWRIEQCNGAINVISKGVLGWMVMEMNNTCHLRGIESNPQRT